MQRLHQDDLVGHVLEHEDWTVLSLPAIAEEDIEYDIKTAFGERKYRRSAGSILQPERESKATLDAIRRTLGEYNYQAQYQQNPTPAGGAMVKTSWLKFYEPGELPARPDYVMHSWDTANKVSELSDYSVCTVWAKKGNFYYLMHVLRRRMDYPELKRAIKDMAGLYRPTFILIEDKASGTQLIQDLKHEGFYNIKPYEPMGNDKVMRLHAQTAAIENGQVFLPKEAPWLSDYIREMTTFPGSKYDDQVDSTAQALDWMRRSKPLGFFDIPWKAPDTPPSSPFR